MNNGPVPAEADLVGAIYECSAFPDRWPLTLERIADHHGALGGNLIVRRAGGIQMVSSPAIKDIVRDFDRQGWNAQNTRVSRRLERATHPGFLTDSHLHTPEELASLPMYTEFLIPRCAAAGAGTIVQGANDDGLIVAVEGFPSHEASRAAVPELDQLRPHLARAAVLSSQIQAARAATIVQAFDTAGSAIALLDHAGKAIGMSQRFAAESADLIGDGPSRLRMFDPESDRRFAQALVQLKRHQTGSSIAIRSREKIGAAVLHVIPVRRDARELFNRVNAFAVLARPNNAVLPSADIITALFDLTPAEARVARAIAEGLRPGELAAQLGLSVETIRSQLKSVFAKTSTRHQSELSSLISRFG